MNIQSQLLMIGLKCGVTWDFKVIAARVSRKNYI